MKQLVANIGEYMYRVPCSSWSVFDYDREDIIKEYCNDDMFKEQILIASESLYKQIELYMSGKDMSEKKKRNFEESILKYIVRAARRTTPFGLFSRVGIGEFTSNEELEIDNKFVKNVSIDSSWIYGFVKNLEKEYYNEIKFSFNKACFINGDRAELIYIIDKDAKKINVKASNAFVILLNNMGYDKQCSYEEMIKILSNKYIDVPHDVFEKYIKDLIKNEILISDLRAPFTSKQTQLEYLQEKIINYNLSNDLNKSIACIKDLINEYRVTKIGEGIELYKLLKNNLKVLYESKDNNYIQIDCVTETGINIDKKVSTRINEVANMMIYLANKANSVHTTLHSYREKFLEKYGYDREVPILEMFDNAIGIGAPAGYTNSKNDFYELDKEENMVNEDFCSYLRYKYTEALINNTDIVLDEADIQKYYNMEVDESEIPKSLELFITLTKKDNEYLLNLEEMMSNEGGKVFGRFAETSERIVDVIKDIKARERKLFNGNCKTCEINLAVQKSRNGNVIHTVTESDYELSLFTNGKDNVNQICLQDIVIGIDRERFYARNIKTGEIIKFSMTNMYNIRLISNPLRFLIEINNMGTRLWHNLPWISAFSNYSYVPKVVYKNVILSKRKWIIDKKQLCISDKDNYEMFLDKWNMFFNNNNMVEKFYISDLDNKLYFDVNVEKSLKLLFSVIKNSKSSIQINEIEDGEVPLKDLDGNNYMCEIVVPLMKKEIDSSYLIRDKVKAKEECRRALPFENWIYFKLYCNSEREDDLVTYELDRIINKLNLSEEGKYFFIRYKDPKRHIRLRINDEQDTLLTNMPILMKEFKGLMDRKVISDVKIDTYEKELERYGTEEVMELSEELFCKDSESVLKLLQLLDKNDTKLSKEEIALASIMKYLDDFGLDYNEQLDIMKVNFKSNKFNDDFRKDRERLLELFDIENNWIKFRSESSQECIYNILQERNESTSKVVTRLKELNVSEKVFNNLLLSLLHMNCNRFLGIDRTLEEKMMNYVTKILFAKNKKISKR